MTPKMVATANATIHPVVSTLGVFSVSGTSDSVVTNIVVGLSGRVAVDVGNVVLTVVSRVVVVVVVVVRGMEEVVKDCEGRGVGDGVGFGVGRGALV